MKNMNLTSHAQRRVQQRGVSSLQLELIHVFGDDHYQKGGETLCYINERKLIQLRNAIDKLENVAFVKGAEEKLVTVMHKDRRIHMTGYTS
jgi:hypothetical protein